MNIPGMRSSDSSPMKQGYGSLLPTSDKVDYRLEEEEKHQYPEHDNECSYAAVRISSTKPWSQKWALAGFVSILVIMIAVFVLWNISGERDMFDTYDYIIVGGGPSGIIAATKLARGLPKTRVLLLESGTVSQSSVLDPFSKRRIESSGLMWPDVDVGSRLNKFDIPLLWSGVASSQGRLNLLGDKELWSNHHWPIRRTLLARALGGCGMHNAMIYVRSLPQDMERWNLTGWTFDTVLEHYQQMETYVDTDWSPAPFWKDQETTKLKPWRGHTGPVRTVPAGPDIDPVAPLFVQSCMASGIGVSKVQGFNDPDPANRLGAGYYEFNIKNGVRDSVAQAFLGDMPRPNNLEIRTGATVTHVFSQNVFGGGAVRAVGVHYVDLQGVSHQVKLRDPRGTSEVIMASGAIMTPQLLDNSGIGDGGRVVDLPGVGKNLQDHPVVAMAFRLTPNVTEESSSIYTIGDEMEDYYTSVMELENMEETSGNLTASMRRIIHERIGALGTSGFSAGAFLRSPWAKDEAPDLQLTVFPRSIEPHVTRKERREDVKSMRASTMLVTVALLRPDARYQVRPTKPTKKYQPKTKTNMFPMEGNPLTRALHYNLPSIDLPDGVAEYLSDHDVERLVWGLEQIRKISQAAPLADNIGEEIFPGTKADLAGFVRENQLANSHWVGSTKMGKDDDPMAVLDEKLRVRGIQNLRIVDSGAMPAIPNGNTHSMVTVVASRAADLIIAERRGEAKK